jgi:hypothetical protein
MKTLLLLLPVTFRKRFFWLLISCLGLAAPAVYAQSGHPAILVKAADKEAVLAKIRQQPWARQALDNLVAHVEPYVRRHQKDPEWILSRYLMNRAPGRRYTHFYADSDGTALVRYAGDAPFPTVRVTPHKRVPLNRDGLPYVLPAIEDLVPYDTSLTMTLQSTAPGGKKEKVNPQSFVEKINGKINALVLDAAVIYWLTGQEEYAAFAADVLAQWARGASYQHPIVGPCRTGFLSIQTLGDGAYEPLLLAYDFLYDYLRQKKYKMHYYQGVFEKIAHTMTFRGYWNNNWFAAQTPAMVFSALLLEDKKQRDYYLDFYLRKDTINGACGHLAMPSVVSKWLTPDGHWKEPGGYHNFPVGSLLQSAVALENNGYPVFRQFPALFDASYVMLKYSFPNFKASSFGDTGRPAQSAEALELGILMAHKYRHAMLPQLASAMEVLIHNKLYRREETDYLGLLLYLPALPVNNTVKYNWPRSGELDFAKLYLQRNGTDPDHGLMYQVQGASYNHNHANGMAVELYGAGKVMGVDPGNGPTYESPMHVDYYAQWAAHNTVVAGGQSGPVPQFKGGGGKKEMGQISLAAMEPRPEQAAVSPFCSFTDTRYTDISTNTGQQRALAIIRTSEKTGYYVDIYRSAHPQSNEYLYHNVGSEVRFLDARRQPEATTPAAFPISQAPFDPPGLRVPTDYQSTGPHPNSLIALFSLKEEPGPESFLQVLFPGEQDREFYTAWAPKSGTAPAPYNMRPTPMLVARQQGQAWDRPFVAVYEPFIGAQNHSVDRVELVDRSGAGTFTALKVTNKNQTQQLVLQSLEPEKLFGNQDWQFRGSFGVVGLAHNTLAYLYLGAGQEVACQGYTLKGAQPNSAASLNVALNKLEVTCNQETAITIPVRKVKKVVLEQAGKSQQLPFTKTKAGITFSVPACSKAVIRY